MSENSAAKPERDQQSDTAITPASTSFWDELKRRHVVRVATVYAVVAWVVIQIADTTFESFGIPPWAFRFIVIVLALGFPISLIITWALELTPEGIKLTSAAQASRNTEAGSGVIDRKRRWFSILFAAAVPTLVFVILVLVFNLRPAGESPVADSSGPGSFEQSIAVLPLNNMSSHADNAFFAGGVHEDILTNLSRIEGLKVISRTSAMRYINSELSLREIGVALGARYIVEGSVRRINNHVRVTVQLIDANEDRHLWANNYDRELVDVFATQSAVAREISNSLHLEIQPETVGALQGMPTQSVKAYDLYIKAKSIDRSEAESESSLTQQREKLEAALQEDPDFVEAWAFLNEVYDNILRSIDQLGWFAQAGANSDILEDYKNKSIRALRKAVALDPDNLETLIARASGVVGEEHLGSEWMANNTPLRKKMMDYTIEKYPDSAMAWYVLGWWNFINASDTEAANSAFLKALELDPLHARIVEGSLVYFRNVGEQELTTMLFERLSQIAPEKSEDESLGQASISGKLSALSNAFRETADQSILDTIAEQSTKVDLFSSELEKRGHLAFLWEFQNNLNALLGEKGDIPLPDNAGVDEIEGYLWQNALFLSAHQLRGNADKARSIARRIIDIQSRQVLQNANIEQFDLIFTIAHVALGERDKAQKWIDKLINERSESYNAYGLFGFVAVAQLDVDRAVKLILEEKAQQPTWSGTYPVAAHHILFRNVVVHPEMQAYYLEDGKWIDYLSSRVPEYYKYRE